jgi:uncharacterized repeat protein (TIGR03803 family)
MIGGGKTLYGTTLRGGDTVHCQEGCGTVFTLAPGRVHTILHSFDGKHGAGPVGRLIADNAGNLYGVTEGGGAARNNCLGGCGTVFKLSADGTETVLYTFSTKATDGHYPTGLLTGSDGAFYGTTQNGGSQDCECGTIFKLTPDGTESLLHVFHGGSDGIFPRSGLVADADGNFYGTTVEGGTGGCVSNGGCGIVFKLAPDGTETVLYAFKGGNDGAAPLAPLVIDNAGNFYGTTSAGGGGGCNGAGCGTVFKLAPDGTESVLHAFQGGTDGAFPWAGVIADANGNLYGTTLYGGDTGKRLCDSHFSGCGTVFKLASDGTETLLKVFDERHENSPYAGLTMDSKGNLYGAASKVAYTYSGVIFEIVQSN